MYINTAVRISSVGFAILIMAQAAVAATHTVMVGSAGFNFDPADITVAPGDTVEWIHVSGGHTVTSGTPCIADGRFNNTLPPAGSLSYVVPGNEPSGVIPYFCIPHCGGGMTGSITVDATSVPAVSTWGLGLMSLLTLIAGTVIMRRKQVSDYRT